MFILNPYLSVSLFLGSAFFRCNISLVLLKLISFMKVYALPSFEIVRVWKKDGMTEEALLLQFFLSL